MVDQVCGVNPKLEAIFDQSYAAVLAIPLSACRHLCREAPSETSRIPTVTEIPLTSFTISSASSVSCLLTNF